MREKREVPHAETYWSARGWRQFLVGKCNRRLTPLSTAKTDLDGDLDDPDPISLSAAWENAWHGVKIN